MVINIIQFMVCIVPSDIADDSTEGRELVVPRYVDIDTQDQARDYVAALLSDAWQVKTVIPVCEFTTP
ncbi:hypothetical protein ABH933_001216 [Nocardia sp. GP40]|uniref:hypothetical protein n=1 Tax=Nocardia sp. GP40 TaxID=3156268 RepID=UPI003D207618